MKPAKRYLVDKNYLFYTSDGTRLKGQKAYKAELKQREESQEIQERRRLEREGQSLQADKKPAGGPPFDVKERKVTLIKSEGKWKAKDGGVDSKAFKGKADTGLFALVCPHEVCLKLVNLYRSGEKMYYPLALLEWLFAEVAGDDARIGLLYDVACNFEAHLKKRGLLLSKIEQVEQVDQVESATRHETLMRDISRKARELVGRIEKRNCSAFVECMNAMQSATAGHCLLNDYRAHPQDQIWSHGTLGAVEHYAKNFPSRQPLQLARSVQEVLAKKPDDLFWSDILFETKDAAWAYDRTCQLGIKALQMRDRCLEEFRGAPALYQHQFRLDQQIYEPSTSSMVLNHTFPQHASSFVGHFASLLQSLPLPILSNMQRPQSAQSSSSKRRRSSAQASQTQTDASANLGLQHTANTSKRLKKNPMVSDGDGTPTAEDK
ncbi:hypothetical protein D1P53_005446 [Cryptococcus gattii VGV]|nr:hypothetical protein D1P53_005446 [Cryptococcus gattii VGV]